MVIVDPTTAGFSILVLGLLSGWLVGRFCKVKIEKIKILETENVFDIADYKEAS